MEKREEERNTDDKAIPEYITDYLSKGTDLFCSTLGYTLYSMKGVVDYGIDTLLDYMGETHHRKDKDVPLVDNPQKEFQQSNYPLRYRKSRV
jgi:hypothetical protein